MATRKYNRRSDDELIAELQARIERVQARVESRKRRDSPVIKELPKIRRTLRKFAQLAIDHGREDLSNSTLAFLAGLERAAATPPDSERGSRVRRGA